MRAALFHETGGPEVIRIEEVADPIPGPGEARITVRASSLNHLDLWVRRGLPIEISMPHIGGSDVAGVVESVGDASDEGWLGRSVVVDPSLGYEGFYAGSVRREEPRRPLRVLGEHTDGGFAELTLAPVANLREIPDGVGFEDAAAAALCFVTAWRALKTRAGVRAAERVLITGASGGVATAAVQLAHTLGAEVHAVTSGRSNVARVAELGAAVVYDRLAEDVGRRIKEETRGAGVDVVVDSVGGDTWHMAMRSLGVGGRIVSYGSTVDPVATVDLRHLFWKQLSVLGSTMGTPDEFTEVMALVFDGRVSPIIDSVMPLAQARQAHERLEAGNVFGKLVLVP